MMLPEKGPTRGLRISKQIGSDPTSPPFQSGSGVGSPLGPQKTHRDQAAEEGVTQDGDTHCNPGNNGG